MSEKNPFDLLLDQIRDVVREEIKAAINGNGHQGASEPLLDVEQLAQALEVKTTWIYEQSRKKADPKKTDPKDQPIPHIRVGRYPRFELSKVKAWLEARQKNN
jgi:predicted DNA-binding transcriptional regulator AlpA